MTAVPEDFASIDEPEQLARQLAQPQSEERLAEQPIVGWNIWTHWNPSAMLITDLTKTAGAGDDWVRIGISWKFSITRLDQEPPAHLSVVRRSNFSALDGCGTGGTWHEFPRLKVTADGESWGRVQSENADFYTLQSRETESFVLPVSCGSPGVYRLSLAIPLRYKQQVGALAPPPPANVICPESFTVVDYDWQTDSIIKRHPRYVWQHGQYVESEQGQ